MLLSAAWAASGKPLNHRDVVVPRFMNHLLRYHLLASESCTHEVRFQCLNTGSQSTHFQTLLYWLLLCSSLSIARRYSSINRTSLRRKARHHELLLLTFGLYPSTRWPDDYDLSPSSLANQLQSLPYRSSMGGYDSFEIKELHPGFHQ
jgi:hypothetical protein